MSELRWGLLAIGLLALLAIYVYTRHKASLGTKFDTLARRLEPTLASDSEPPADAPPETLPEPASESIVSEPEPLDPGKVITVRMMARQEPGFQAEELILALRDAGLKHGRFGIFHRIENDEQRLPDFSVASLVEPGSFDLTQVKTEYYPGVSIFMSLPGPRDGVEIFDDMLETSRALARKMDGDLRDEHGSTLSVQRERYIREEVIQFEHRWLQP